MMRGMQAGMALGDAYKSKTNAEMQSSAIEMQMQEIDARADVTVENIQRRGERVVAEQKAAYQKSGFALEGSAMEVVADTLENASEAAMLARRQADYDMMGLAMQQAAFDEQASDINFILNSAAGLGSAYAGYQTDQYNYNRGSMRNRSAGGIS